MSTLAAMVEGKADTADVLFLAAFIVFVIVAVVHAVLQPKSITGVLLAAGLACLALAWLVL